MGYNTLFALKAADLPLIAQDPEFGAKLRDCMLMSETRSHLKPADQAGSGIRLSNVAPVIESTSAYDMQVGVSRHADEDQLSVVKDGLFWTFDWTGQAPWDAYETLALKMAGFGYSTSMKTEGFVQNAQTPVLDDFEAEWSRMDGYSQDAWDGSLITFSALNDAMSCFRDDKELGARIDRFVRDWWHLSKLGHETLRNGSPQPFGHFNDYIRAGNHANPIGIIAVTPAQETELVMVGGNWGRKIANCPDISTALRMASDPDYASRIQALRDADLHRAKDALLTSGFHVRLPGRQRSESPMHWSRDKWVSRPVADTPEMSL